MYIPEDDNIDEDDGQIEVTILPSPGYRVASSPADTAIVTISDNDELPKISIEPLFSEAIIEGQAAQYLIVADKPASADITIQFRVSESNTRFLAPRINTGTEVTLQAGRVRALLVVPTESDLVDEPNGEISAEIIAGTNYIITTDVAASEASMQVLDDDAEPLLSIQSVIDSVVEGTNAEFIISSPTAPANDLVVDVTLTKNGGFFPDDPDNTVTLIANSLTTSVIVLTDDDKVEESETGKVIATINPSTGYQVSSAPNHEAEVIVTDNDIPPEMTITRISENSIVEGATATFRISSDQVLKQDLEINLTLDISGGFENYISSVDFIEIVLAGQTYLDIPIPTTVNNIDESTKIVKVTLKPATTPTDYRVGTVNSAQIDVLDSDLPEISIRAGTEVTEGNTAQFFIVADIARQSDLIIGYSISAGNGRIIS